MYLTLKSIHLSTAALTFVSFSVRGIWMLRDSAMLERAWVKVLPHVIDAVLLGSAIGLIVLTGQYPGTHAWLTAKLLAVVVYIALGSLALKRGRTKSIRIIAWLLALGVFSYIVAVALSHNPAPFASALNPQR